jgi:hypothetical protein
MADFFLSNLKSTLDNCITELDEIHSIFYFIFSGAVFYTGLQVHPIPSPSGPI